MRYQSLSSLEGGGGGVGGRNIAKFFTRKDDLHILRSKKRLKSLDPTILGFPEGTKNFIKKVFVLITETYEINAKN